ncbi:MAG TPA: MogA/MoaB family molybdenum cofactor biosynthesis protein [Anaerolineae bacterium]|nr:MogA/MoaB family molybdenum cofactor biosynthesis protein [Anaerolineae bacterium]
MIQVAILTVSDRSARGERPDAGGPVIEQFVRETWGWPIAQTAIIPDDASAIGSTLVEWCDVAQVNLIFTTGGTGFAPRDVTPEATRAILDREAPGLAEAMRAASLRVTPHAMLSRAVCGMRGRTLIVNLPGSPKACLENLATIAPALPHALQLLREDPGAEAGH